jgi:hypothetical protein
MKKLQVFINQSIFKMAKKKTTKKKTTKKTTKKTKKRWKAMRRHIYQLKDNCKVKDELCRPRQRQALLHWAYDTRKI